MTLLHPGEFQCDCETPTTNGLGQGARWRCEWCKQKWRINDGIGWGWIRVGKPSRAWRRHARRVARTNFAERDR